MAVPVPLQCIRCSSGLPSVQAVPGRQASNRLHRCWQHRPGHRQLPPAIEDDCRFRTPVKKRLPSGTPGNGVTEGVHAGLTVRTVVGCFQAPQVFQALMTAGPGYNQSTAITRPFAPIGGIVRHAEEPHLAVQSMGQRISACLHQQYARVIPHGWSVDFGRPGNHVRGGQSERVDQRCMKRVFQFRCRNTYFRPVIHRQPNRIVSSVAQEAAPSE